MFLSKSDRYRRVAVIINSCLIQLIASKETGWSNRKLIDMDLCSRLTIETHKSPKLTTQLKYFSDHLWNTQWTCLIVSKRFQYLMQLRFSDRWKISLLLWKLKFRKYKTRLRWMSASNSFNYVLSCNFWIWLYYLCTKPILMFCNKFTFKLNEYKFWFLWCIGLKRFWK